MAAAEPARLFFHSADARSLPIGASSMQMPAPSPGDPMEITTPTSSSPPPSMHRSGPKSPASDGNGPAANGSGPASGPGSDSDTTPKTESHHHAAAAGPGAVSASSATSTGAPAAAAPAVHQPKIVQTAFIHKLYNMLEDPNIQHLISWSNSAESFVMSPSNDFSKVLAQYFKHTNISSFVRQLNMYGFHKVSDVFANGSDSTTLWEFKHGNGNFKRGDLIGLREIKRRASRHSLVHRDYNSQKPPPPPPPPPSSLPGTPAEPAPLAENADLRMGNTDHFLYSLDARLQRTEEAMHYMNIKHQAAIDTIGRLLHFNQELSRTLMHLAPNPDSPIHREIMSLQGEMQRQADVIRAWDNPHDSPFSSTRPYFSNVENGPVSPRQIPHDDLRRLNLTVPPPPQPRATSHFYRPSVPSSLSINTRRPYGSIGGGGVVGPGAGAGPNQSSPSSLRTQLQPPPPPPVLQHPLATVEPPPGSMGRRHTSADIRAQGWQPANHPHYPPGPSGLGLGPPLSSGALSPHLQYPPSPSRPGPEDQHIRESFSAYSLQSASKPHSRPATPPPPPPPFSNSTNGHGGGSNGNSTSNGLGSGSSNGSSHGHSNGNDNGSADSGHGNGGSNSNNGTNGADLASWSWAAANRGNNLGIKDGSGPPTRRGSMAHILNPTDTAEREDENGSPRDDDRKRKRIM